jgi:peptidyl-prolyl cis-trans isomerase D
MFDSIRNHQKILQFFLLVLIVPAFVFFGVSGYERFLSSADDVVAEVGKLKVTKQEFERARSQQMQQMKQVLGEQFDPTMLDTPSVRKEVIDSLVSQRALLADALDKKVSVSDGRLVQALEQAIPGLKQADGTFNKELYRSMLIQQGLTEAGFEAQARRDLSMQTSPEALIRSAFVPKAVVDRLIAIQEEQREVSEMLLKPSDFLAQVKTTPEQLKKYYDDNIKSFEIPESAKVEYLVLSSEALGAGIAVDANEVKTYFDQNKSKYSVPEQRQASHVLVSGEKDKKAAKEKAESLLKQIKGGADFATMAKANSDDPGSGSKGGDLGFFSRDMMVKPFSDAAYAMKEGDISDVVESEFGFHIIKLTGIKGGGEKKFDDVKAEIEADFKKQKAQKLFTENTEQFNTLVYEQSDSLKPAADKLKLTIQTAEGVTRLGAPQAAGAKPSILNNPKLLKTLFSDDAIVKKRNVESVEVSPGVLVSARIVDHKPSKAKPFETVENEVRGTVIAAESRKLAAAAGEAKIKELKGKADGSGFTPARVVSRGNPSGLGQSALDGVYKAAGTKLPAYVGVDLGPAGYGVYQVSKIVAAEPKRVEEMRTAATPQIAQVVGQQDLSDLMESVKSRYPVKIVEGKVNPAADKDLAKPATAPAPSPATAPVAPKK